MSLDGGNFQPLNPELYARLQDAFGTVLVANEGVPMVTSPIPSIITGKVKNIVVTAGESYRANCFAAETLVATPVGDVPIGELAAVGKGEVLVPNKGGLGIWKEVEFRSFGKQPLLTVHLKQGAKSRKIIRATPDHRWLTVVTKRVKTEIVLTKNLKPGDKLGLCMSRCLASYSGETEITPSAVGVAQGFIFGDGCRERKGRKSTYAVLHATKDKAILPYFHKSRKGVFKRAGKTYPTVRDLPRSWKKLPDCKESLSFLLGWLSGYCAADGTIDKSGKQAVLNSAFPAHIQFAKGICYQLGIRVSPMRTKYRTTFGKRRPIHSLSIAAADLPDSFWLLKHHRQRALKRKNRAVRRQTNYWIVERVENHKKREEVFCAVVPGREIFTLADNIRTMNCPYCQDTKHRLWIGYLYGQPSATNAGHNEIWLANCFHTGGACLDDFGRRKDLENRIFGFRNRNERGRVMPIADANWKLVEELSAAVMPGAVTLLSQLPANHPARQYAAARNYDPDMLSNHYGVGYCTQADPLFRTMQNRLTIPIFMHGQMVGWQGRTIVPHEQPRYYFRPGMPKSRMLYNFDAASQWPFVIVTEGAVKVWRIGAPTVAIFGKTLSFYQRQLLEQQWAGKPVLMLLDADAKDNMAGIIREMKNTGTVQVVPIELPEGMPDPDECEHDTICGFIRYTAAKQGVELPQW